MSKSNSRLANLPKFSVIQLLSLSAFFIVGGFIALQILAARPSNNKLVPNKGVYFGTYIRPRGATNAAERMKAITATETQLGRKYDIDHQYYSFNDAIPTEYDKWTATQGRIPFISYRPTKPWAEVTAGAEDTKLRSAAQRLKTWGVPAYITIHHEPGLAVCPGDTLAGCNLKEFSGTSEQYKSAWRHVYKVLNEPGNDQLVFVYVTAGGLKITQDLYPGDDVVDWLALNTYNFIDPTPDFNADWKPFASRVENWYGWASTRRKPLMINEWGCFEDPNNPSRKAQWLADMQSSLRTKFPAIKAILSFDSTPAARPDRNWQIDTSPASLNAYRTMAKDPYFNPSRPAPKTDRTPPTVSYSRLKPTVSNGQKSLHVTVKAKDASGIAKVEFRLDGQLMITDTESPYVFAKYVSTSRAHTVEIKAYDNAGNVTTRSFKP